MRAYRLALAVRLVLALIASIAVPASAFAAPSPANTLLAGTIDRQYLSAGTSRWCMFEGRASSFYRSGRRTFIVFPTISIVPNGSAGPLYTVGGQGRMRFRRGSSTTGTLIFLPAAGNPNPPNRVPFSGYVANYNTTTHTLSVSFTLTFPSCTLPVNAVYWN